MDDLDKLTLKEYDDLCGIKRKYISTRKMAHIRQRAKDRQQEKIAISARTGEGIERLRHALREAVPTGDEEQTLVTSERHYEALTTAAEALKEALHGLETDLPTDLLSEDIRSVIAAIGTITARGTILPTEVLAHIFGHFCIGK